MAKRAIVVLLVLGAASIGSAGDRTGGRTDPADPSVSGPAPRYDSAFDDYRDAGDRKPLSWKDANEEVGRLGGHAGHAVPGAPPHGADRHPASPPPGSPGGQSSPAPPAHGADHGK